MKTIGEVIKLSTDYLAERKVEPSRRTAEAILSSVLQLKKMELYLHFDKPIVESELTLIRQMLKRCAKGEPVDYVTGEVEFYGCKIKVDSRVLIPRPETEILVDMISKQISSGVLWDLCTGSGCIGISLKKAHPELSVTLSDLSKDALELAKENAQKNGVEVDIVQGDLLGPFSGRKADFIVCNPPYITEAEYSQLDPSVRDFEPKLALVGGVNGIEYYQRLARELPARLNPSAKIFFEIGSGQGAALKSLFPNSQLLKDWSGHDRFMICDSSSF
ncbi:MAG: peptide chain release factor N(5)-glutamine methyltransferase [Chlamydiae bacterium CG10_big_fil_rev_8_21_14_0_10_42_34]|nr:MAG: peptide chain release factor N(5)-glutamine methyltransferase [Chlamydiae bacterium CG10_big_fil_rev_8_21_14_0_10_42_34]